MHQNRPGTPTHFANVATGLGGLCAENLAQIVSLGNRSTGPSTSQSNMGRKNGTVMVADTSNYEGGPDLIHPLHYPAHGKFYHRNPKRN